MVRVGWKDQQHAAQGEKKADLQRLPEWVLAPRADPLLSGPRGQGYESYIDASKIVDASTKYS